MQTGNRRPIGQILLNGGLVPQHDLERALEEQRNTNELLGQTLVRMGILDPTDIKAALSVQHYLNSPDDAVKTAAGVRQMLGDLLLQAGHITSEQLEGAFAEQKRTGEKLGEVLVRMGLLTDRQLNAVLDFQRRQGEEKRSSGPLRLGELLVSKGYISHEQLDDALYKQALSKKKLGEVLIEEKYAKPDQIRHGIRLQNMLMGAALAALLAACGSVDSNVETQSDTVETTVTSAPKESTQTNFFAITIDEYGLLAPTFYYSTNNGSFWSIQADIANDIYDPDFKCVIRIDILKENGAMPAINKTFSIEDNGQYEKFPGTFFVFNGQESTNRKVEQGTISFTSDSTASGNVTGSFDVILTDYDSTTVPAPQYNIKGDFSFKMGTYGPATSS